MTLTKSNSATINPVNINLVNPKSPRIRLIRPRPQLATWVMLGVILGASAISMAWLAGCEPIATWFEQLNRLQQHPPFWLTVPTVRGKYLIIGAIALAIGAFGITKLSPQPRPWSSRLVVGILLILTARYVLWRALATLNLSSPLNGIFSLGLFLLELLMLASGTIQLGLLLNVKDRRREADHYQQAVLTQRYQPTVDILIPSYDEPAFILRRTIIGCQAIDYTRKTIYLLDDTNRPEIAKLAKELGCRYITRSDNQFAKAGNLNHALKYSQGELMIIFDADFIPTRNFISRTIGFFQNPKIALVQTPQSFYNADPIARNLGLENVLTPEEEVFYRQIQPMRDGAGGVICAGTSFVVRRDALEAMGGFVTDSLSEDYFTGIRLAARGHELVYLDEKLSAGLAAENMAAHAMQRLRWVRGTLQAFFISANPLTIPGLQPLQRLAHLEGLLYWFTSLSRVWYLLIPLAYSFLHVIPVRATARELAFFFLPYYLVQLAVFAWLNQRSRSAFLSDIYSLVLTFPLAVTTLQVMLNPFSQGFKVTPKGTQRDRYSFNWNLAFPLIVLFIVTAFSFSQNLSLDLARGHTLLADGAQVKGIGLGWFWSGYNLVMLAIALLILLDAPKPDRFDWFDLRCPVRLTPTREDEQGNGNVSNQDIEGHLPKFYDQQDVLGITTMMSEGGAAIQLAQMPDWLNQPGRSIALELTAAQITVTGLIVQTDRQTATVRVKFAPLTLSQHRRLVELLYCRPGQWLRRTAPGEIQSLLLLGKILLKPRFLWDRKGEIKPIAVSRGHFG
jgi:cellulose synthase (UDP-forming)